MPKSVTVNEAKAQFSELIDLVRKGEEVIITETEGPVARLVPYDQVVARRTPGTARGQIRVADDFDAPLPVDSLRSGRAE